MTEIFTPHMVVSQIMDIVDKDTMGYKRLKRFSEDLGYTAPEIRDARFWGAPNLFKDCITDICRDCYDNNEEVHKIFRQAVVKYQLHGGFIYKKDLKTSHVSNSPTPPH